MFEVLDPELSQLHNRFLEQYGHAYQQMVPRFAQRHDPHGTIERSQFEYILGIDTAHDTHPISQWLICREMQRVDKHELSERDWELLRLAEVTHDYGEALTGKDIAFGDKVEADETTERQAWLQAIEQIGGYFTAELLECVDPIVHDPTTRLGQIFNISEHIGYIRTGLRAAHLSLTATVSLESAHLTVLESIATDVRSKQEKSVEKDRARSTYLDRLLTRNSELWDWSQRPLQVKTTI